MKRILATFSAIAIISSGSSVITIKDFPRDFITPTDIEIKTSLLVQNANNKEKEAQKVFLKRKKRIDKLMY